MMTIRLFFFSSILFVMACSSHTAKTNLYTLNATLANSSVGSDGSMIEVQTAHSQPFKMRGAIGVGPIVLPESLDRSEVVILGENQQIFVDQSYQWAGDLKQSISRVLASNLSRQLAEDNIWPFPWDVRHRPETQVSLIVERLGGALGKTVELNAKWKVLTNRGSVILSIGRCDFSKILVDASYDTYVAAINDVVESCSLTLAESFKVSRAQTNTH